MPRKLKKRPDGRYCQQIKIGYENGKPKVKSIYGRTQPELDKKVTEFKANYYKDIIIDDKGLTVAQWAPIWLKTYKTNVGFSTYTNYRVAIDKHIVPYIGNVKLSKVSLRDAQNILNILAKTYSWSMVKKVKETLNQLFLQALRLEYIYKNPVDGIVIPKTKQKAEQEFIPEEHVLHLLKFCQSYKYGAFIITLLYTGMRRGELVALTWDDIDFENNAISITKSAEFIKNQPIVKHPKTEKGIRVIPLLKPAKEFLIKHKKQSSNNIVFINCSGNMHTLMSLRRLWDNFLYEYNIFLIENTETPKKVRFTTKQFRHTYATLLYKAKVDKKMAQEFMGHSSYKVTNDIYTHIEMMLKKVKAQELDDYVSEQTKNIS